MHFPKAFSLLNYFSESLCQFTLFITACIIVLLTINEIVCFSYALKYYRKGPVNTLVATMATGERFLKG